jgi:four helix bundle protein
LEYKGVLVRSYKDLEIYQLSYKLAVKVHKLTLKLPKYELYEEGRQIRKSSKGITSCIVEGYGRKRYKADFLKFLTYSHASCDETIVHLNFIKDTHENFMKEILVFLDKYNELGAKVNKYIQYVEKEWK